MKIKSKYYYYFVGHNPIGFAIEVEESQVLHPLRLSSSHFPDREGFDSFPGAARMAMAGRFSTEEIFYDF